MVNSPWAIGGTITKDGNDYIHTFTSNGNFILTGRNIHAVDVLVVAGGGAGQGLAGGGAGGLLHDDSLQVSPQSYSVTVGAGGVFTTSPHGENSVFSTLTAIGGGASASPHFDGGSGAGANTAAPYGLGTSGQGHNGGAGAYGDPWGSGGGGGAGVVGQTAPSASQSGNGGNGSQYDISGANTYYAGGGGGSTTQQGANEGQGGLGGGGAGAVAYGATGTSGTANTGGGGGGQHAGTGGNGGSGIVIIRYSPPRRAQPIFIN